jgi:hypothetical protein
MNALRPGFFAEMKGRTMKRKAIIAGAALAWILTGCSTPVSVATVGPNPANVSDNSDYGRLQVFSALVGRTEGDNPTWYQHRNYVIVDQNGKTVMRVANRAGKYDISPQVVSLKPGKYIVKAESTDYFRVEVPVLIERGMTTRLHLDDTWKPANASQSDLVILPSGTPVGWSLDNR